MKDRIIPFLLTMAALMFLAFVLGINAGMWAERTLAIKADAGRWVSDRRTGETTFVYGIRKGGTP